MKKEKFLRAKIDAALVETLPRVGYERIRGRRELQDEIVKAVKAWLRVTEQKST